MANGLARAAVILALSGAVLAAACRQPFLAHHPLLATESDSRFRSIQPLDAERLSRSPPVAPEDVVPEPPTPPGTGRERAPLQLPIEDAREAALTNNLTLRAQLVDPEIAGAALDAERAKFEAAFVLDASVRRTEVNGPLSAPLDTTTSDLEPGIRIPLRTGGEARVGLPLELRDVDPLGAGAIDAYDSGVHFSISQPLLRGGGTDVATASIQIARFDDRRAEARAKLSAIRVLAAVEKAYWNLWAATREVEILHDRYAATIEQLDQARRLADGGVVADVEVLRAEAGVARRLDSVIAAETRRRIRETDLLRIMNRPDASVGSGVTLLPDTDPRPRRLDLDADGLARLAVQNRMELLELELQLAVDAIDVGLARNAELPAFALDFDYTFKGTGESWSASRSSLGDTNLADWVVGARIDVPIGNEAAHARVREAVLRRARTLATRALRELAIRQEVQDALDQLEGDFQRVLAARRATILVGRNFEAERRQFQAGVRTSTEVLEAADFLAETRTREARALADHQISMVDLAFATGTVLGESQVRWPTLAGAAHAHGADE